MLHSRGFGLREFYGAEKGIFEQHAHLDIVERKQSDHSVVFPFVPIFVDLFPDEYDVTFPERQFSIQAHQSQTKIKWFYTWLGTLGTVNVSLPGSLANEIV